MKKNFFKATIAVAAVAAIGMGSFKAYSNLTASDMNENGLVSENVLALAEGGNGGVRYSHLLGRPKTCTLDLYISAKTGAGYKSESEGKSIEGNVEFKYTKVQGMYDSCPKNGDGCSPYSCQQVAY